MNAHTAITNPAALSVFWRKGRGQFVPLTNGELDRVGLTSGLRQSLHREGLLHSMRQETGQTRDCVWAITEAGIAAYREAMVRGFVFVPKSQPAAKIRRGMIQALNDQAERDMASWRKRSGFRCGWGERPQPVQHDDRLSERILAELAKAGKPMTMSELFKACGRTIGGRATKAIEGIERDGFVSSERFTETGKRRTIVSLTPAGREWLAQNGGAQ